MLSQGPLSRGSSPDQEQGLLLDRAAEYLALAESGHDISAEGWLAGQPAADRPALRELIAEQERVKRLLVQGVESDRSIAPLHAAGEVLTGEVELLELIGRGGMGEVWRARDLVLDRVVAVKFLRAGHEIGAGDLKRLEIEAMAGARLGHEGIVSVLRYSSDPACPFIVMEYVAGARTLRSFISECRAEGTPTRAHVRFVVQMFVQLADALQAAHDAGVLHRDLKPSNVLLTADGRPKVADFGLARIGADQSLTRSGALGGTEGYWSPEAASGGRAEVDARSDVYSLGATLFEALTLSRAFEGTRSQILEKTLLDEPPNPRQVCPDIPAALALVVMRAMARRPRDRYGSMRALADDLRAFLSGEPVSARPAGPVRRTAHWVRRNRRVAALSLLGMTVMFLLPTVDRMWDESREARLEGEMATLQQWLDVVSSFPIHDPARGWEIQGLIEIGEGLLDTRADHEGRLAALGSEFTALTSELEAADPGRTGISDLAGDALRRRQAIRAEVAHVEGLDEVEDVLARLRRQLHRLELWSDETLAEESRYGWDHAIRSIASRDECPEYDGLRIEPQVGLAPLRRDPGSGLWEFYVPQSGVRPLVDHDSARLVIEPETAIVMILVPGGELRMGADPDDPWAQDDERPAHDVWLAPYFLSKYEVTQAQFERVTGFNPSDYFHGAELVQPISEIHPVESVTWDEARRFCAQLGLSLPTEAQWERAARGYGQRPRAVEASAALVAKAFANLDDDGSSTACGCTAQHPDGFQLHAPVDAFGPDGFGFFQLAGNVQEWCADYYAAFIPGDGRESETGRWLDQNNEGTTRVLRGGSYGSCPHTARPSFRSYERGYREDGEVGLRPARALVRAH